MHIDKIFSQGLLDELLNYTKQLTKDLFEAKVRRVYFKCMRNGHPEIAQRIADKYPEAINIKSDAVMAFGMALMAQEKLKGL